jgi:hypothetical protein
VSPSGFLPIADAIVVAWLPGMEAAGITQVLFGEVHPTGKLPRSWPSSSSQIPTNEGDANYNPVLTSTNPGLIRGSVSESRHRWRPRLTSKVTAPGGELGHRRARRDRV